MATVTAWVGPQEGVGAETCRDGRWRPGVSLIPGDGAGPEAVAATRQILDAAGAEIEWELVAAGDTARAAGVQAGLPWETLDSMLRTGLVLKGPLGSGGWGAGSCERLLRQSLEAFLHLIRVHPFSDPGERLGGTSRALLLVRNDLGPPAHAFLRELSAGQLDPYDSYEERVVRAAFDLACLEGRSEIRCAVRPCDPASGVRTRTAERIAQSTPDISLELVNPYLLAQTLALAPHHLDVVITSGGPDDLVCELAVRLGGGGAAVPSVRYGPEVAIFEAAYGVAPGGVENPDATGLVRAGIALLRHVGQAEPADRVERALAELHPSEGPSFAGVRLAETVSRRMEQMVDLPSRAPRGASCHVGPGEPGHRYLAPRTGEA